MVPRRCICLLLLLMTILISYQHPMPELNVGLEGSQHNEKEHSDHNTRNKRQVEDGQYHYQGNLKTRRSEESERNKRLDADDESALERNQFYKPVSEETRDSIPFFNARHDKEVESDHRIADDLSGAAKLEVVNVLRPQRQAVGVWADVAGVGLGNVRPQDQRLQQLSSNGNPLLQTFHSSQAGVKCNSNAQEMTANHLFSQETLETMKKINPLTIGDQVSQMMHDRKCNIKNKLAGKAQLDSRLGGLQNEDQVADPSFNFPSDNDDAAKRTAYDKQGPPKMMPKPCPSNDYGFSVIILAGDPLKMVGSAARCENSTKEDKSSKKKKKGQGSSKEGECVDGGILGGKPLNEIEARPSGSEFRVQKDRNAHVEFPVYDQDLTNVPDPFNGLLEQNYWIDHLNKVENPFNLGPNSYLDHNIRVRRDQIESGDQYLVKNGNKNDVKSIPVSNGEAFNKNGNKNNGNNGSPTSNGDAYNRNGGLNDMKNGIPVPNGQAYNMNGNKNYVRNSTPVSNEDADETTAANLEDAVKPSGDTPQPELEPFGDLNINANKTSCISYKDPISNNNTVIMKSNN